MDALLAFVLDPSTVPPAPPATDSLAGWWDATAAPRGRWATPVERAAAGGAFADRLGYAFAGGYAEALRALVPDGGARISALCATEEGGNHPRAIRTSLVADGDGYRLTGRKKWGTMASSADQLLVVASTGVGDDGRNRLRVVRVAAAAPGVRFTASSAPFVPEIPHAEVELDGVAVAAADLLPGDGYDRYLKPFRTVEDLHVHAALLGYLIGVVRRHRLAGDHLDALAALLAATCALAAADPRAPATHLALAGLIELVGARVAAVEEAWRAAPGDERGRWQRDRPLLAVAGKARAARRAAAHAALATG